MIATVLALAFIGAAALPLAVLLDPSMRWRARAGVAILLGFGVCASALFVFSLMGFHWSAARLIATLVLCLTLPLLSPRCRRALLVRGAPTRWSLAATVDCATLTLILLYAAFVALGPMAENDFLSIWGGKGKQFFETKSIDWRFLEDPNNDFIHPDYPLLVPLSFDAVALLTDSWDDQWLALLNAAFALALLLIMREAMEEETGSELKASVGTLVLSSVVLSPWVGLAEQPMIAYSTAGLLFLRRGESRGRPLVLAAVLLGLTTQVKNEGLTLCIAALIACILLRKMRSARSAALALVAAIPWLIERHHRHLATDLLRGDWLAHVASNLSNAGVILRTLTAVHVTTTLFWAALAACLLVARKRVAREPLLLVVVVIQLFFFLMIYAGTPNDVLWQIRWSWERLVGQLLPIVTFAAVLGLLDMSPSKEPSGATAFRDEPNPPSIPSSS